LDEGYFGCCTIVKIADEFGVVVTVYISKHSPMLYIANDIPRSIALISES
jgi:hypothetical protein